MDAYEIVLMCPPWRNVGPTASQGRRSLEGFKRMETSLLPLSPYRRRIISSACEDQSHSFTLCSGQDTNT